MKWSEAESRWKESERERDGGTEREWVKNGPTVETAVLSIPCLRRREKHPHTHQYDERPSPKPYMEKSRFFSFFVVFLICLFICSPRGKKQLKTNETIKKPKKQKQLQIYNKCWRGKWTTEVWVRERDSVPGVHSTGLTGLYRSGLSAEMPVLKPWRAAVGRAELHDAMCSRPLGSRCSHSYLKENRSTLTEELNSQTYKKTRGWSR